MLNIILIISAVLILLAAIGLCGILLFGALRWDSTIEDTINRIFTIFLWGTFADLTLLVVDIGLLILINIFR